MGKREECQGEEEVKVMMRCHTTLAAAPPGASAWHRSGERSVKEKRNI